ncbi:MAG: hypothetical protein ACJAZT_001580 [Gammaproteobacteria bacterium]|jgi:hypothetical protein
MIELKLPSSITGRYIIICTLSTYLGALYRFTKPVNPLQLTLGYPLYFLKRP